MNGKPDQSQRSLADFVLFALMFFGFVLGAAGVVTSSVPASITGFVLMLLGAMSFSIKGF
jgi:hypothetical protein